MYVFRDLLHFCNWTISYISYSDFYNIWGKGSRTYWDQESERTSSSDNITWISTYVPEKDPISGCVLGELWRLVCSVLWVFFDLFVLIVVFFKNTSNFRITSPNAGTITKIRYLKFILNRWDAIFWMMLVVFQIRPLPILL